MKALEELSFYNTYNELGLNFQSPWLPAPVTSPEVVAFHPDVLALLDLSEEEVSRPEFARYMSGNELWPESKPLVQVYGGHQFGEYQGRLGDGRCILVGEVRNEAGEKWDLELKGAGATPHSRGRSGRLGLADAVREFLGSEALAALGIPTTRSLCLLETGVELDGAEERALIVVRLARTHVRFGTFQYFYHLLQKGWVRNLANHVIRNLYPDIELDDDRFRMLLRRVVERTAELAAAWQAVGFCHGQLNTDDMSVDGVTLDLGPFGFVEAFDPAFSANPEDAEGRYRFGEQPEVIGWNLKRFGETLLDFMTPDQAMGEIDRYRELYDTAYRTRMRARLGLGSLTDVEVDDLLADLFRGLESEAIDLTTFFRHLADVRPGAERPHGGALEPWLVRYAELREREGGDDDARVASMNRVNPVRVPRRTELDEAVESVRARDFTRLHELQEAYRRPFG